MLLFESVGGPLWVFVGFGDVPSPWTLASGALLIGALVGHEVAAMHAPDEEGDESFWKNLEAAWEKKNVRFCEKGKSGGGKSPERSVTREIAGGYF